MMNLRPALLAILVSMGLAVATSMAEEAPLLTLEEALSLAKAQNLQLKNADLQINVVEEQKKAVESKQYPQLSAHVHDPLLTDGHPAACRAI